MSSCSSGPAGYRRRATAIGGSLVTIAAAAPLLLRHSGSSDWSDSLLGGIVGMGIGIGITVAIVTMYRGRSAR